MDWSRERYVRLYTRDTTDWLAWSWEAQALFCFLLRKLDRSGCLALGKRGRRGVYAHVPRMPPEIVDRALDELFEDGCCVLEGSEETARLRVRNFEAAQEAVTAGSLRTAAWRAKKKLSQGPNKPFGDKTSPGDDETSTESDNQRRAVTCGDTTSPDVTKCDSVPSRTVPSRTEVSGARAPGASQRGRRKKPEAPSEPMPYTVGALLAALCAGSNGLVAVSPCIPGHAVQITARIRELHQKPEGAPDWPPPTLAEWSEVGKYISVRWSHDIDLGPGWAATEGKLADVLAKTRRWVEAGRPALSASQARAAPSEPAYRIVGKEQP